jgi:5-methylcytosine-specific restriction endonuclease McrA
VTRSLSSSLDLTPLRVYEPDECGADGYPLAWHNAGLMIGEPAPAGFNGGVKHLVRELAGHRCQRCLHPFVCGVTPGEWSPCDERCTHKGPARLSYRAEDGSYVENALHDLATEAGVVVGYGKRVEAKSRVLTVHHLRLGHDAKRWWNLAALCQRCHLQIQGKVQMERVWPYEHSEWFKPYAAGWYAWSYLGLELSRDETIARLDELLALELAA